MLASVLLMDADGKHLKHGAAPSLPDDYNRAMDGEEIGPAVGSCGTSAFRNEPVYVSDIATDPLWTDFKNLALSHGLKPVTDRLKQLEDGDKSAVEANAKRTVQEIGVKAGRISSQDKETIEYWERSRSTTENRARRAGRKRKSWN